jgi:uncharacterized Zn-binding protein involved in type VI secretion
MPGITVKGLDSAGGVQLGGGQSTWKVDGQPIVLLGDPVAGHAPGPHQGPTMAEGSAWMTLHGKPVVRAGHKATCGHAATGRPWFNIA